MADLSSLFGSSTPASVTGTITNTSSALPAWLQEYTRGLASAATTVGGEAYQPYTSPANASTYGQDAGRIAGYDPSQTQAYNLTQSNVGSYKPYTDYASQTIPQVVNNYMSPYTDSVVNRIQQLGNRNLTENLMPAVNSTFAGAGQFGSTRNADFAQQAMRNTQDSILGQQSSALQAGYTQAQNAAQADMQRQAALGQQVQNQGYQDVTMLDAAGQQKQALAQKNMDLANTDFTNQVNYPKTQLSFMSDIIRGMPTSSTGFTATSNPSTAATTLSPLAAAAQAFAGAKAATGTNYSINK